MIGSNLKCSVKGLVRRLINEKFHRKMTSTAGGKLMSSLEKDHDFTAEEMKQAVMTKGVNEDHNKVIERWFKRATIDIDKHSSQQSKVWNKVTSHDKNYMTEKNGFHTLRDKLQEGEMWIKKTRRGLSVFDN